MAVPPGGWGAPASRVRPLRCRLAHASVLMLRMKSPWFPAPRRDAPHSLLRAARSVPSEPRLEPAHVPHAAGALGGGGRGSRVRPRAAGRRGRSRAAQADVAPLVAEAAVSVAPIRVGSGTRIKILGRDGRRGPRGGRQRLRLGSHRAAAGGRCPGLARRTLLSWCTVEPADAPRPTRTQEEART